MPGKKFEFYPIDLLAKDINPDNPPEIGAGFGGITLAYNVEARDDVDKVIELVRTAGGTVVKEPSGAAITPISHTRTGTTGRSSGARISNLTKSTC